jgi:hypothetical protein
MALWLFMRVPGSMGGGRLGACPQNFDEVIPGTIVAVSVVSFSKTK